MWVTGSGIITWDELGSLGSEVSGDSRVFLKQGGKDVQNLTNVVVGGR